MQSNGIIDKNPIQIEGHLKIWDPESKEVFVNQRAENVEVKKEGVKNVRSS